MTNARWRPRLAETLAIVEREAVAFKGEWRVLGSAAAALIGADVADVADVDLLLEKRDAEVLIARWSDEPTENVAPSDQFRSEIFARFTHAPLAIEVFGGFSMRVRGIWREIKPLTRVEVGGVFTPSVAEQITLLEAMGREKDRARIKALRARI